jgi:hypothetical protein
MDHYTTQPDGNGVEYSVDVDAVLVVEYNGERHHFPLDEANLEVDLKAEPSTDFPRDTTALLSAEGDYEPDDHFHTGVSDGDT